MAKSQNQAFLKPSPFYWQFYHIHLKIYVSESGKYQEVMKNILLRDDSFYKIQDGSQLWPIESIDITSM